MEPSKFKRLINIIFIALLIGMVGFTAVTYFVTLEIQYFQIPDTDDVFLIIVPLILIVGIISGNVLFKKLNEASKKAYSLKQKAGTALTSNIIRYALIEVSVFVSIIAFLGSANLFYIVFAIIGILYFITLRPTDKKLKKDLNLTHDDCQELGIS